MTRDQEIAEILLAQDLEEVGYHDEDDDFESRKVELTDELDYYPEDEFEADQRNYEFDMIDPLGDDD